MFQPLTFIPFPPSTHTLTHTRTQTGQVERRQISLSNRQQVVCQRTSGTCNYYSSCLEPQFPCGNTGLVLQYAKKRCNAVRKLDQFSTGCSTCITNEALVSWSHTVEECVQDGLNSLVTGEFHGRRPDPTVCLSFERRAIEKINACYRETHRHTHKPKLCHILGDEIDETERQDLRTLVSNFNFGDDYHSNVVDSGIAELVRECGHPEVANSLYVTSPTTRIVLCTWGSFLSPSSGPEHHYFPQFLSGKLRDRNLSHFVYGGQDVTDACKIKTPSNIQDTEAVFHIVTWFAPSNHPVARNWSWNANATFSVFRLMGIFGYFELTLDRDAPAQNTVRDRSKCGDGIRHAGEECDYAKNTRACSFKCTIQSLDNNAYECSVERLDRSYCWAQACGDGRRTSSEECDDGNLQDNDGCNSRCRIEPQYSCKGQYNSTTECRQLSPAVASQHQSTRSQIILQEHTEPPEVESASLDGPLEISSARSPISRTGLLLLTVSLATLWTALTLV